MVNLFPNSTVFPSSVNTNLLPIYVCMYIEIMTTAVEQYVCGRRRLLLRNVLTRLQIVQLYPCL